MDQCLQLRKIVDQEIRWDVFESFRCVAVCHAARLNRSVPPGEHIDGGVSNHPGAFTMTLGIHEDLKNADWIRFLMVKAIAPVHCREMFVDAKPIEHCATEVDGLVRQHGKLATAGEAVKSFADARIKRRAVQHMSAIVRKKHLQTGLNIGFGCFRTERPADQHQGAISDKTGNLVLRQSGQLKLMTNVVYGSGQIFFRVD